MTFGENLKEYRRKRRLSQRELSRQVGLSQSYIGDLERNRKNVSIYVVAYLAKQLDVSVNYLFNDDTEVRKCNNA
ncbi:MULTISPECIES: helix-turn-helix domain-containing protein [Staphylococcus]|uniref:helix-turn-helix domain-containing protein n=1 Tax=Staphylococcus TaxID=1279 RepID=UPI0021D09765|nr:MULTISPECIES: helix-turn-helix transcriptional regulator [Staphylococcus]UXS61007.1 helix-turn-helix domain-containing protein [Staphylococcus ureilyticus]UXU48923.1 helix-turn-helix domain-containing protein [Staphylococcus arlettae]